MQDRGGAFRYTRRVNSKHVLAAPASVRLISPAKRRFAVSLLAGLAIAVLPNLPGARSSSVHLDATPAASGGWLDRLNAWRASTGLSSLTEVPAWSTGDYNHSLYMVKNDLVTHYETPGTPYYTTDGDIAAQNGNIQVSSTTGTSDQQAIDWWMAAPFHAMGMMDPRLTQTGFGSYREVKSGWQEGATLDTLRGNSFTGGQYPVYFPGNGTTEPLTTYGGGEFPDALQACPGYSAPTGLPVFIEVGGNVFTTASPTHSFTGNGVALEHCIIDSTVPSVGSNLTGRGGVIVVPKQPLQAGVKYVVAVNVNSVSYTWSFTVGPFWGVTGVTPGFGPPAGGTAVTITGTGFTGATSVKFGTTAAASFSVVNDTTITAVSPAHALGLADVTVTTPAGTSAMLSADQFAYATPCTAVTLSAAPPSPSPSGTQVTFTGSATCPDPNPLYEFWALWQGESNWQLLQGYSTSNVYHWNSTGALGGIENVGVWVRDATSAGITASSLGRYDSNLSIPYTVNVGHCTSVTVSAAPASPVASGTLVSITGTASGCANPVYEFWARWQGYSTWQLLQGYSSSSVYHWNSTGAAPGTEYFGVWARDASSSAVNDTVASIPYSVTSQTCASVTVSANPTTAAHGTGAHVIITGLGAGCTNPLYEFWARWQGSSTWQLLQGYSANATYNWNSTGAPAGTEYFGVWVRDASSAATVDSYASIAYALT